MELTHLPSYWHQIDDYIHVCADIHQYGVKRKPALIHFYFS